MKDPTAHTALANLARAERKRPRPLPVVCATQAQALRDAKRLIDSLLKGSPS